MLGVRDRAPLLRVGVFAGSLVGDDPRFERLARELGAAVAKAELELVYGACGDGLVDRVALAALANGGKVTAVVTPSSAGPGHELPGRAVGLMVGDLAERNAVIMRIADGFVVLPGGFETFDDLFGVLALRNGGHACKPIGVLGARRYYRPLLVLLERAVERGFVAPEQANLPIVEEDPARLIHALFSQATAGSNRHHPAGQASVPVGAMADAR